MIVAKWLQPDEVTFIYVPIIENPKFTINVSKYEPSDVKINFTSFIDTSSLPFQWQEIQIVDVDDCENPTTEVLKFIFYYKNALAPNFKTGEEPIIITLKLYSTRELLGHRDTTIITQGQSINDTLDLVFANAFEDGYTIVFNDLNTAGNISVKYIKQTLEKILNDMSIRYNFIWFCDALKNITIRSVTNIQNEFPTNIIDATSKVTIQPIFSTTDYANVVDLKNIVLIDSFTEVLGINLDANEIYNLQHNTWIAENAIATKDANISSISNFLTVRLDSVNYTVSWDVNTGYTFPTEIGFDGVDNENVSVLILLIRDGSNNNLITGLKVKSGGLLNSYFSSASLVPYSFTLFDIAEIDRIRPFTNTSGKIEKPINLYNKFMGKDTVIETAKGNLVQSNRLTSSIRCSFEQLDLATNIYQLGTTVRVDRTDNVGKLVGSGTFVITDLTEQENQVRRKGTFMAKSTNLNETFIDLYRNLEIEDNEDQIKNAFALFASNGILNERPQVLVDGVLISAN